MKTVSLVILMLFVVLTTGVYAEQQYNPYENTWETVPDNSNWDLEYNPYEGDWSYQPPKAEIEYNPHAGQWDWNSGVGND